MCSHGVWEVFVIFQFYGDPMNLFLPYHVPWVYLLFLIFFRRYPRDSSFCTVFQIFQGVPRNHPSHAKTPPFRA